MKAKKSVGKKIRNILVPFLVVVVLMVIYSHIPAFADPDITIKDNCMTVVNENEHYLKTEVIVQEIDSKGNITVKESIVEFGVGTYTFDDTYFQKVLETENKVYIVETSDNLFDMISNYSTGVAVCVTIFLIIVFIVTMKCCYGIISVNH